MESDIQIRNGLIVDGSGSPARKGCLDIGGGRITAVHGPERPASHVIDAVGCIVCPGFIDAHTHADLYADDISSMESFLYQGVTTCVVGNCGFSAFPIMGDGAREYLRYGSGVMGLWQEFSGASDFLSYRDFLEGNRMPLNIMSHVGHGTLRTAVMGQSAGTPDEARLGEMCRLLERLFCQGAAGLSLGLIYLPGSASGPEELCALARVATKHHKPLTVHLRNEGDRLLASISEMLELSRQTDVSIHVSHHKVMGRSNHGLSLRSLAAIESAKQDGLSVSLDAYPYDAGCSTAIVLLPPWVLSDGISQALELLRQPEVVKRIDADLRTGLPGWENLSASCGWGALEVSSTSSHDSDVLGKSLEGLGNEWGMSPLSALICVILREQGGVSVTIRGMSQQDVDRIITYPETIIGSDGLFAPGGAHPRRYGAFAKIVRDYVEERGLLSIELAISKMTGKTARVFHIPGRGLLKVGYWADIAVFSPDQFRDTADYQNPALAARGMEHVFVSGVQVLEEGKPTGCTPGKLISV